MKSVPVSYSSAAGRSLLALLMTRVSCEPGHLSVGTRDLLFCATGSFISACGLHWAGKSSGTAC